MKYVPRDEKLRILEQVQAANKAAESAWDAFYSVIGADTESPLGRALFGGVELSRKIAAQLIGDDERDGWLEWYATENGWGANGMEAGYGDTMSPITSLDDLLDLLEEGVSRA